MFQISTYDCGSLIDVMAKRDGAPTMNCTITDEGTSLYHPTVLRASLTLSASDGSLLAMENPWLQFSESSWSIAYQVIMLSESVAILCFAVWRFSLLIFDVGLKPIKMVHVVLGLEILGLLLRILFAVDPLGMRLVYDPFFSLFFYTPNGAVSLMCDVIILFYWNRAMNSFGTRSIKFLTKYLYVFIAVICVAELTASILRSLEILDASLVVYIVQGSYVLFEAIIVGYTIYTAVGLYRFFKSVAQLNAIQQKSKRKVIRMTKILLFSSVFLFILVVSSILGGFQFMMGAISFTSLWFVQHINVSVISLCHILALSRRKGKSSKSSRTNTGSTAKATTELASVVVSPRVDADPSVMVATEVSLSTVTPGDS